MSSNLDIRVYYEDTDAGGVVYYANYLKYTERGRTEFLRDIGLENSQVLNDYGLLFVVKTLEASYLQSAKLDDLLTVNTKIIDLKNASFSMNQSITRNMTLLFSMDIMLATVNQKMKPSRMPIEVKRELLQVL